MPNPLPKKKARIAKYQGDDQYSWAVFVGDRLAHPSLTGMSRLQANYYKNMVQDQLDKARLP